MHYRGKEWDHVRFHESYTVNDEGCWIWNLSGKGRDKRPRFFIGSRLDNSRKDVFASRWIWEYENGPIPEGMLVLHKCDNNQCVNPAHLYLGTPQDNMGDKHRRGRAYYPGPTNPAKGEKHGRSKLSEDAVQKIRLLYLEHHIDGPTLSRMFGVSTTQIYRIVKGTQRT